MSSIDRTVDDYLTKAYYTKSAPASYSSASKLWKHIKLDPEKPAKLNFKTLLRWYDLQDTHIIHKRPVRRFRREPIVVEYSDQQWDSDLITLNALKQHNDGYCYILGCIDLFSRYAWAVCLKTKSGNEMKAALQTIFSRGRKCEILRSDRGAEYTNGVVRAYLRELGVKQIFAYNELHANYIERWNRTMENKLYKYFYEHQTLRYVDVLDDMVASYNATIHSTINMAPRDVTDANSREIYERVYMPIVKGAASARPKHKFSVGDKVRLSYSVKPFQRGYAEQFSEELFEVTYVLPTNPPRYKLVDMMNDEITGSFYESEMVLANPPDDSTYKIDKVISRKKINGVMHGLVNWYGYGPKFRTWVPVSQLKDYSGK